MYETAGEETMSSSHIVSELTGQVKKSERTRLEIDLDPEKNKIKIWFNNDREKHTVEEEFESQRGLGKYASEIEHTQVEVDLDLTDNKIDVLYKNRRENETGEADFREVTSSINSPILPMRRIQTVPCNMNDTFKLLQNKEQRNKSREKFSRPHGSPKQSTPLGPKPRVSFLDPPTKFTESARKFPPRRLQTKLPRSSTFKSPEAASTPVIPRRRHSERFGEPDREPKTPRRRSFCGPSTPGVPSNQVQLEKPIPKIDINVVLRLITYVVLFTYCFFKLLQFLFI